MSAIPRYLQRAREALDGDRPADPIGAECERSEKSEKSLRFEPGERYKVDGPVIGIVHRWDQAFDAWRVEMRLPRAGIMTIDGEMVVVADVRAALRSGYVDVVAVRREATP